jgi:ABC-type transporter Mla MlaB component
MSVQINFIPDEKRLDLSFDGNLDVTVWQDVCDSCRRVSPEVRACIVDLTRVERVFDSGVALLAMLSRRLRSVGATIVFLSDDSTLKERISAVASPGWYAPSLIA